MAGKKLMPDGLDFTPTVHNDTYPAIDPATKSDCTGKSVFVTGTSKGIGRATALAYAIAGAASIGLGARSDLTVLEKECLAAAEKAGKKLPKVLTCVMDVSDREAIEKAAKEVETSFGRLDILVNNAGYLEDFKPIVDSDPDEWWKTWTVNVRGPYLTTRAFLPLLLKSDGDKTIINLSSIGAHLTRAGASGYQTTKLAVTRFTEFIMAEYGEQGVLAWSCHPGGIMTELAGRMPQDLHHLLTDTPEVAGDTIVYLTQKRQEWLAGRYVSCTWDMPQFFDKKNEIVEKDLLKVRMAV